MNIGNLSLGDRPVMLAPMEDVTDAPFRSLCRRMGAAMVYSEFVSSDALIRMVNKSLAKLEIMPEERPVAIQIYGKDPGAMAEAAQIVVEQAHPDVLDMNFGCPVKKVAGKGAGAGLLRNIPLMLEIARRVVDAVDIPVTAKTRLGWDHNNIIITDLAESLQDTGIRALTIHGRTRSQVYNGEADWEPIRQVRSNPRMHIPIIGNGDIDSPQKAREAFDRYGVDGIMVARATYGRPWIFRDIRHYLDTGELLPEPSVREKVAIARRHLRLSLDLKGEPRGVYEMRRHLSCYFRGLPDFKETRIRMVTTLDVPELFSILDEIEERYADL